MYENRSNAYQKQPWKQKYLTHKLVLQSIINISSYCDPCEFRDSPFLKIIQCGPAKDLHISNYPERKILPYESAGTAYAFLRTD